MQGPHIGGVPTLELHLLKGQRGLRARGPSLVDAAIPRLLESTKST